MSYEDIMPHTHDPDGTPTLPLPIALGVKLKTWYLRQDTEDGWKKLATALTDIRFLCRKLKNLGLGVTMEVAKIFPTGCYSMLLLTANLKTTGHCCSRERFHAG